jgi:ribosome assembly protein YihI (activator of Der GTPase)
MEDIPPERKFLHDLATPLVIIGQMTKRVKEEITQIKADPSNLSGLEKTLERLEKILTAVKRIEDLHADHKSFISKPKT